MQYFEDFPVGRTLEMGPLQVKADDIVRFARQFDPQSFHVDREAAARSIYGGLIASGWHTTAVMMRLMCDSFLNQLAALGSPGFDDLRWLKPVRAGDTIHVRSIIDEVIPSRSRADIGSTRGRTEAINQHGEVVLVMTSIGLYRRRPAAE